jgi:hypothetical protein
VTAEHVLCRATERGLTVKLRGADRLVVRGPAEAVAELRSELLACKPAIVAVLHVIDKAEAIARTQRLLREGHFPSEPAPCAFHCGYPHERCKRCGAAFAEHYSGRL